MQYPLPTTIERTAGRGRQAQQQRLLRAVERGGWVEGSVRGLLLDPRKLMNVVVHTRAIQVCRREGKGEGKQGAAASGGGGGGSGKLALGRGLRAYRRSSGLTVCL